MASGGLQQGFHCLVVDFSLQSQSNRLQGNEGRMLIAALCLQGYIID